ncbi:MAG TPA: TIM barrel protein [Candidatus Nitrosotalea sp.]|nr:TIM barrel protein [Candidatus Nitrosotalea sp.]
MTATAITRRRMLALMGGAAPILFAGPSAFCAGDSAAKGLGIGMHSYGFHWRAGRENHPGARFNDALTFLEYCHSLGAVGVQVAIGDHDTDYANKLRARAETLGMYIEAQTNLPKDSSDVARFEADVLSARNAGAEMMRTAMLGGRRYETFDSVAAFAEFAEKSWQSLVLAEPVLRKHRLRLAIENHKDRRVPELLDLLKRIDSEYVGVCVDTGNNLALLEEPMGVVEALAPHAFSSHLKDMAVTEYESGFLLSEVPLGEGFLDLKQIVGTLRKASPGIHFNLEMITRDPLEIPCLTERYWTTMKQVPASDLAAGLKLVRQNRSQKPLPKISGLSFEQQLESEDENVRKSLAYAHRNLGL